MGGSNNNEKSFTNAWKSIANRNSNEAEKFNYNQKKNGLQDLPFEKESLL